MSNKKVVKLAVIRTPTETPCPFGLDISLGCKNAGDLITKMAPLTAMGDDSSKEEKMAIAKANKRLFMWHNPGRRCEYAGKIFEGHKAVECNWGSNAPGVSEKGLLGAPFYSKVYNNIGLDGIYSYPLGYYADNNISRNIYYGIYSLMGEPRNNDNLKKFADYLLTLDGQFSELKDEEQEVLRSFARDYANNKLFKRGAQNTHLDEITTILMRWKDENEPS